MNGAMLEFQHRYIVPAALSLLPKSMSSEPAIALLLAVGLQESGFQSRRQIQGPARGFWQFEEGNERAGMRLVLSNPTTAKHAAAVLLALKIRAMSTESLHQSLEHNDVLACAFARLMLWALPRPLPQQGQSAAAWDYYLDAWNPGKPRPEDWPENYARAWAIVKGEPGGPSTNQ
jgi:hypothetical protein